MLSDANPAETTPMRWPRGQKFTLSVTGLAAEDARREAVNTARASGRTALETALAAWATAHAIQPDDGVVLAELRGQRRGLKDLVEALEVSGFEPKSVRAAVDRLVTAGLAEAIPLGAAQPS